MKDEQLHAAGKTVQQMSRQGLVEENLSQKTVTNISKRQENFNYSSGQTEQAQDYGQYKSYYQRPSNEMAEIVENGAAAEPAGSSIIPQEAPGKMTEILAETGSVSDVSGMEPAAAAEVTDLEEPVPAEEFASLLNRMTHEQDSGGIENELGKTGQKLLDHRSRKQKTEINRRQRIQEESPNRRLQYETEEEPDEKSEKEETEKEGEEPENAGHKKEEKKTSSKSRLRDEKKSKLNFEKDGEEPEAGEKEKKGKAAASKGRLREEKKNKLEFEKDGEVPKHLLFEESDEEEEDAEKKEEKYAISHKPGKRRQDGKNKQNNTPDTGNSTRLKFREEKKNGPNRKLARKFEESQEEEMGIGAQSAFQAGHESARLLELAKGSRQLKRLRQEEKRSAASQEQTTKLKEGSRYFKPEEKENTKKKYQKKINQQKAVEHTQQAIKNTAFIAKVKKAAQQVAAAAKTGIFALCGFILLLIAFVFVIGYIAFYLMHMGEAGLGALYGGLYQSTYSDISHSEAYFRELETDLEYKIAHIEEEEEYTGCYEYIYDLGDIGHQAVSLISYLSVKYTDFTLEMCKEELDSLFKEMYTLTVEIKQEERERQKTDEDGNLIYDSSGNPVKETFLADICYVTLKVKPWDDMMEERLTEAEKSRYKVYLLSQGAQQVYANPLEMDWKNKISSPFGYRIHPITKKKTLHAGIDIAVPEGTPLHSCTDGTVMIAQYSETAGNYIVVQMESGYTVKYMHLDSLGVHPGDRVSKGMLIGATGNTGNSTGPHLHLEVRTSENTPIDPTFIVANGAAPEKGEE